MDGCEDKSRETSFLWKCFVKGRSDKRRLNVHLMAAILTKAQRLFNFAFLFFLKLIPLAALKPQFAKGAL